MITVLLQKTDEYYRLLTAYMGEQYSKLKLSTRAQDPLNGRLF